ncbi:plasmid partition protein [Streptomyces luteolus]|uniref:Plasmid partition protein n=1 Tax=Streptomyces luteolus TaxID=3043615 RepID=A0ABT6TB47_9ACTN|nr:plasmid partition protein [Streptomyces sp. B-S-A12]MDI3424107.1 plasmid partition protein [Streptomyces sp. B-S-A12]
MYDADESQQLAAWARDAGDFPCQVVSAATAFFADTMYPFMEPERINLVDVGHAENHPEIVDSVLEVADAALVTVSPTQPDYQRLMRPEKGTPADEDGQAVREPARHRRPAPTTVVLLNRCQAGAKSTGDYKSKLRADGWDVLTSTIPRREAIASVVGFPCDKPERRAPYDQLVTEFADRGLLK